MLRHTKSWIAKIPVAAVVLFALGCATASEPNEQGTHTDALLARCDQDSDCGSGLCSLTLNPSNDDGVCSLVCESDAECESEGARESHCATLPAITEVTEESTETLPNTVCLPACEDSDPGAYECVEGRRRFCDTDSVASCQICGCRSGELCDERDNRCKALLHGAAACGRDEECLSRRCLDGQCAAGQGDTCDETCDGTCGGPPDALYCIPRCVDEACPTDLPLWKCLATGERSDERFCGRVCRDADDCIGEGDVCEPFEPRDLDPAWAQYFAGYCVQP